MISQTEQELQARISQIEQELAESKQANAMLRQQQASYESLMQNANDGISIAAADGKTVFANAKFAEMVGYSMSELSQTTMKDLAPPDEYPMLAERLRRRVAGEAVPNQYETAIRRKDGRQVPIELTAAKTLWQGQPADLVIIRDISARKQSEELLAIRLRLFEFATTHSLPALLQKTLDEVGMLVASPIGFYHFVEVDQNTLALQAWSTRTENEFCTAEGKGTHYSIDRAGVWVDAVHQRRPVIHNDYASLPHRKGLPEGHAVVNRELVVPILREDKVVAILGVGNKPTEYTDQDVKLVAYLADVAWEITTRKKMEQELQQHRNQLEQLVQARTAELVTTNQRLAQEIKERERAEQYLTFHAALLDEVNDAIIASDAKYVITVWNRAAERMYGWRADQVLGKNGVGLLQTEFGEVESVEMRRRIAETGNYRGEATQLRQDGTRLPVEVVSQVLRDATGAITGYVSVNRDISERKRAEEKIAQLAALVESSDDIIISKTLDGVITSWNKGAEKIYGYPANEIIGQPIDMLAPAAYIDEIPQILEKVKTGTHVDHFETVRQRKDGQLIDVSLIISPVINSQGQIVAASTIGHDITERKRMERELQRANEMLMAQVAQLHELQTQLREQAIRDPLTQLYNRRYLNETLPREIARALRQNQQLGILMLDVDHFKRINDTFGHAAGDVVLQSIARLLQGQLRASDIVCRYGGEEILCLLLDTTEAIAYQRAEHLCRAVAEMPIEIQGITIQVTASIGVAVLPPDGTEMVAALNAADAALYHAKQAGRNCVRKVHVDKPG